MNQRKTEGSVALGASEEAIESRILEVLAVAREDLTSRGIRPPYSAPPLPTNFKKQLFGDYLHIARYSADGLRIVVQVVLDEDMQPWYMGVRVDAFEPQ